MLGSLSRRLEESYEQGNFICNDNGRPGLVKIGKVGSVDFEQRMYSLERNGYFNVVGLKRSFAIEVEDYNEKKVLLDAIFSKLRVPGSELFALNIDLVIQLLSSLEGKQIYSVEEMKE